MIIPNGNRIVVKSRGTKQGDVKKGELQIPEHLLKDSNVCMAQDGRTVIIKGDAHVEAPTGEWIVNNDDVLAEIVGGVIIPLNEQVLVRKCLDPDADELIVTSLSTRKNQFGEILAVSADSVLKEDIGWLALIDDAKYPAQKIEGSEDDWLVSEDSILMIVGD